MNAPLTPRGRGRPKRLPRRVEDKIRELADEGTLDPKAIVGVLRDEFPEEAFSLRTVQRRVSDSRARHGAGLRWTLTPGHGDQAQVVLGCLAALVRVTRNPSRGISIKTAEWIMAVAGAAPDLPDWSVYQLARRYEGRTSASNPTDDLDLYLAMGPWRSMQAREAYEVLCASDASDPSLTFDTDDLFEWTIVEEWVDTRARLELAQERGLHSVEREMRRRLDRLPVPGRNIATLGVMVEQRKRKFGLSRQSASMAENPEPDGPDVQPHASAGASEGVPSG
jgi:hypothetical protein